MDLGLKSEMGAIPDVGHQVRQLRWFKTSFRHDARLIAGRYGVAYEIDDRALTEALFNWADAFSSEKGYARLDRRDFIIYAAGLLLRELLRSHPASARLRPGDPAGQEVAASDRTAEITRAWPEGFLYTNYCLCVVGAVLDQEGMPLTLPALADDLRTWWSYRENAAGDPSQAIAFFDLLTGGEPNWWLPDAVASRTAMKRAAAAGALPRLADPASHVQLEHFS